MKTFKLIKSKSIFGAYLTLLMEFALDLLVMAPSSGGLERVFSTMGFVHSGLRNRFGTEKVSRLAFFPPCFELMKLLKNYILIFNEKRFFQPC